MRISVNPDWWRTLFDEIYLVTDKRSVDNIDITRHEIDILGRILPLASDARILDLCGGQGRHTLELCRRGYKNCTVLDYSRPLLSRGHGDALRQNLPVRFIQGDARSLAIDTARIDHVLILGNSLGYLADQDADLQILRECQRVLAARGWLLLDVTDGGAVRRQMTPNAWHEIDGEVVVCREREIRDGCVCAREMVLHKSRGLIRDQNYRIRLYSANDLTAIVAEAGFTDIQQHDPQSAELARGQDVGCMQQRLLISARKP
ncbi:MAG: class I SAM-dependent methyltransferase [Desulfobacterales bacterium]|jgi:D-alanine-D-alanine ligase